MPDILHTIDIAAPADSIWPALTTIDGIGGWWTIGQTTLEGDPSGRGAFIFRSGPVIIRLEVTTFDATSRVEWRPVEANAPGGWIGTTISFTLVSGQTTTRLSFEHNGFVEDNDGYRRVTAGWGQYLQQLKRLVEDGQRASAVSPN